MILLTILLITLLLLMFVSVISISIGGAAFIIVFSDVIVCVAIIIWMVRHFTKRKK